MGSLIYTDHKMDLSDIPSLAKKARKILGPSYLLTLNSAKIEKGEKLGYLTGVLYMPSAKKVKGLGATCTHHILAGCSGPCLESSGRMPMGNGPQARQKRLKLFTRETVLFFALLIEEARKIKHRAEKKGFGAAIRLDGTTDLIWNRITINGRTIHAHLKDMGLFTYDYTKNPSKFRDYQGDSLTLSYYAKLDRGVILETLKNGRNIAIAYAVGKNGKLPDYQVINGEKFRVIDGDISDLRFLDDKGVIVGLRFKTPKVRGFNKEEFFRNSAKLDRGFVVPIGVEL